MGGTLEHWLGFQDKIGRAFMMNEDALKYPLSDYLVNDGKVNIDAINLEYSHPDFTQRLVDLVIKDISSTSNISNGFEFKLAKSTTRHQNERRRIFNDLIRLHLLNKQSTGKCYFIIAGKSIHFQRDFRKYKYKKRTSAFYDKWFSYQIGKNKTFKVSSEGDSLYKQNIYDAFISDYKGQYKGPHTLTLPSHITTKCEFLTAFKASLVPYMAGIWSVD